MKTTHALAIALGATLAAGCAYFGTTPVERNWGRAQETNTARMIEDPDADKELVVRHGIDGRTGEIVIEKYERASREKPASRESQTIIQVGR